jgi:hypothetical protein
LFESRGNGAERRRSPGAEVPAHAHVAHNARFSSADESGDESWNITTCRDIPSDMLIDLTSDNTRRRRPGPPSSVASSQRDLRGAQNEAARTARLAQDLVDEEELELDEQEAIMAAKTKTNGARVR